MKQVISSDIKKSSLISWMNVKSVTMQSLKPLVLVMADKVQFKEHSASLVKP